MKEVKAKYAEFLGYDIEEVSSGDIDNHIKIGFLKYDKSQFEILEHVCENNSELVMRNLYNIGGKEVYLEERFILLKDYRDKGLKILIIGIDKTDSKLKDDEITNLILKERNLYDELNKANDTIKTLENNLRNG
ncbi:MAG: hypothetical protein IPO21_20075 [Bacteroidales bacterium]|nr:hypothetical protein [Bacteroidales bacterium]